MTEHPILFSGAMVRAILDGKKTQTRRVVRLPHHQMKYQPWEEKHFGLQHAWVDGSGGLNVSCPYGKAGDRLWVRETWMPISKSEYLYKADYGDGPVIDRWHPSIHMPRAASRINLEIVSVRVERVQEITDDDALAEGVDRTNTSIVGYAKERYRRLWDSINDKRGYGWNMNPWVWVVEFKRGDA